MSESSPQPPLPRPLGRGLDLAALAIMGLEGTEAPPPPVVDGYTVEKLLGTGGLGHVWKAIRHVDQSLVALKLPHHADPAFAERLHAEAESLRSLDHPHVLRCLSHGELPTGLPWLALEYVDGSPLSVLIPTHGFSWAEAFNHFRRIAAAVSHAHDHGVLHRDLKPSNILIGHDGSLKVADFGLARSVAERVVTFSLTLSGQVAGTAEYLAPECYSRDYRPAAAADIYALGVILYEMLVGHPPRGAWSPVSEQKQVDIRLDDVLQRALSPDPAKRFPTVRAMQDEIERIVDSPPRYAGTPRHTRAVRFMDFLWTGLGSFILLGAFGLIVRVEKYGFGLPVDLIGTETIRIGTYQGVVVLLVLAVPMGLWQLSRLWHFRAVPLREALPTPLGLKLGTTRIAAMAVLLAQCLFLIAPTIFGAYAWREKCTSWLTASSSPWQTGLVVSYHPEGRLAHDPWAWPEPGREYFLRERSGWITDPLSTQLDMTSYWPGFMPRFILALTAFSALVLIVTVLSAFARWWRFRKWGRAIVLLVVLGLVANAVAAERRTYAATVHHRNATFLYDAFTVEVHTSKAVQVHKKLLPEAPPQWEHPPPALLEPYADTVDFGDGVACTGAAIADWLADFAARSRAQNRSTLAVKQVHFPESWRDHHFLFHSLHLDFTDPPDGPSTGALTILGLKGNVLLRVGAEITAQYLVSMPLWEVKRRTLSQEEASAWAASFLTGLLPEAGPFAAEALSTHFYPQLLQFASDGHPIRATPSGSLIDALRASCAAGARPRLTGPPAPATTAPGGRQRLLLDIDDRGEPATWLVDLIFSEDRWQCVRLKFEAVR